MVVGTRAERCLRLPWMTSERQKAIRKYIVYHLKLIELLHLFILTMEVGKSDSHPANVMGHNSDHFKETLLGMVVTVFMSIADDRSKTTNVKVIWEAIYPRHVQSIDRIWKTRIAPGIAIMKHYRDRAGAHGDEAEKYFAAKMRIIRERDQIIASLDAFLRLSIRLTKKQAKENPEFESEIESVLLDIELNFSEGAFNRRWLREMHLIPTGPFTRTFS